MRTIGIYRLDAAAIALNLLGQQSVRPSVRQRDSIYYYRPVRSAGSGSGWLPDSLDVCAKAM